ncbi:LPS sulfotransferase NodH [Lewinella aquimaris]|uniref:LPS sulfotransferase NodH n=1 Tax=Neolewinella aquimaris TaxID=1835722 RepID=A0A840ECG6_9BACT|nr:Stf0 family sulfotransferase [Neolewinella aquimaris]MBB4079678.1 LPS sulfotransferase NodH [Neolewinella aquimaris]
MPAYQPHTTYRIWFSQRNGSTLLCKGLEQTGVAGTPGEYFNLMESESLRGKYGIRTYDELKAKLWEIGGTPNGVFGIKHSLNQVILDEIRSLRGIGSQDSVDDEALLADLFPNCKHIYLTRRNKVRQAVSWWKAIKDNVWHLDADHNHTNDEAFYRDHYDFAALSHLFKEANLRECAIQEYFTKYGIRPLTLVYEDFIHSYRDTIRQLLHYLGIPADGVVIQDMYSSKTATERSELWVQRFRTDLQLEMEKKVW